MVAIRANIQTERGSEQRSQRRRTLHLMADTWSVDASGSAIIYNLSRGGMLIDYQREELVVGDTLSVVLPYAGPVTAKIKWRHGKLAGCEFAKPISQAAMSASMLRAEPDIPGPQLYQKAISEAIEEASKPQPVRDLADFLILGGLTLVALLCVAGLVLILS